MDKNNPLYKEDLENIISLEGIGRLYGKSVLITGASGLIGVCLIDALMLLDSKYNAGIKVYAVGRSKEKAASRLGEYYDCPEFHFIEQDVRDAFPDDLTTDFIIPLASNTHPLAYSKFPVDTIEINVKGAENALRKAVQCSAAVIYPSSVEIYGNGTEDFDEEYTGKLNLSTSRACYTESKRTAEALCQSYISQYGVQCSIARLSRVFGPTMLLSDSKASSQFIKNSLSGENIVLKSKGEQYFSYTYVADAVQAILFVLLFGENGQAYNVASDRCNVRLADFARACAEASGTEVVFDIPSSTESRGYSIATKAILSTRKLRALGWEAKYDFQSAISRTLKILEK